MAARIGGGGGGGGGDGDVGKRVLEIRKLAISLGCPEEAPLEAMPGGSAAGGHE